MEARHSASREDVSGAFRRYNEAVLGFRNYWYPVMESRALTSKPVARQICGERIVLVRDRSGARALFDRCPHRGIPLSTGTQYAPGTLTCPYHGWTYDLQSGELVAVLTDRPDSPICGKVRVKSYPVEERLGIVWVYIGDDPAPPVEADIPSELFRPGLLRLGDLKLKRGNWRYAMENSIDEGHARFLHRLGIWQLFREVPAWTEFQSKVSSDPEPWIGRDRGKVVWQDDYPRVGAWPPKHWWQGRGGPMTLEARLPCIIRNTQPTGLNLYNWWVPVDESHYLRFMNFVVPARGLDRLKYKLWFELYARWARFGHFSDQDQWMIELMQTPPERLYGPDKSITAWRRFCQEHARGAAIRPPGTPVETYAVAAGDADDIP